jgi:hypothetical protein
MLQTTIGNCVKESRAVNVKRKRPKKLKTAWKKAR